MNMRYYNRTVCQIWNPFIPDEKKNLECASLQNTVTHHVLEKEWGDMSGSVQFKINFQFQLSDWCRLRWRTIKFQSNTIHYTSNSFNSTTHNFRLIAYLWNFLYLTVSNRLWTLQEPLFHCFRNLLWHIQNIWHMPVK